MMSYKINFFPYFFFINANSFSDVTKIHVLFSHVIINQQLLTFASTSAPFSTTQCSLQVLYFEQLASFLFSDFSIDFSCSPVRGGPSPTEWSWSVHSFLFFQKCIKSYHLYQFLTSVFLFGVFLCVVFLLIMIFNTLTETILKN